MKTIFFLAVAAVHVESFQTKWIRHLPVTYNTRSLTYLRSSLSDESMGEILEEMFFSGDIEGFMRRRSKDVLQDDFISFLSRRVENCEDDEEKQAISDVLNSISGKMMLTDGLGENTELVFDTRLDKILFTNPNKRSQWVTDNAAELTPGFIEYIKTELKNTPDRDSKVVLASVLQLIGQNKGQDLLGSDASLLVVEPEVSFLNEAKSGLSEAALMDRNEQILAGLMFSSSDLLEDVLNNIQYIDNTFVRFLEKKIDASSDMEERVALKSLLETIVTVLERVKEAQGDSDVDVRDNELSIAEVKQRMQEVQMGKGQGVSDKKGPVPVEQVFSVQTDQKATFMNVLQRFQDLPEGMTLSMAVDANYDLCDKEFMETLKAEIDDCRLQGADIEAEQFQALLDEISRTMVARMTNAQGKLQAILERGKGMGAAGVKAMETEIVALGRRKELDEALMLLMEANLQQAADAGATPVVDVFRRLIKRMIEERERNLPDEQRLLRQLLRLDDSEERKGLLYAAFKPTKTVTDDGGFREGPPIVAPPRFIEYVSVFLSVVNRMSSR
eukprot:gene4841-9645_t